MRRHMVGSAALLWKHGALVMQRSSPVSLVIAQSSNDGIMEFISEKMGTRMADIDLCPEGNFHEKLQRSTMGMVRNLFH